MVSALPVWALPIILSSICLGVYKITTKLAVKENAVVPVVFFATLCGSSFFVICSALSGHFLDCAACSRLHWFMIAGKSLLVACSWLCSYYAMRELPVSIAVPISATTPLWTFTGGVFLYSEIPNWIQACGMLAIFCGYYLFSVAGKWEGFSFLTHRGVWMALLSVGLNACSALYDKYLLNVIHVSRNNVQFWFSIGLVFFLGIAYLIRTIFCKKTHTFQWRWSIPVTGILLIIADYIYFYAVSCPGIRISELSLIRRSGCAVAFFAGILFFKEKNAKIKTFALALIFAGVAALVLFRR